MRVMHALSVPMLCPRNLLILATPLPSMNTTSDIMQVDSTPSLSLLDIIASYLHAICKGTYLCEYSCDWSRTIEHLLQVVRN